MDAELREKLAAAMHDAQVDRRFTEAQTWDTAHKDVQALFLLYADALAPIIAEVEAAAVERCAGTVGAFLKGRHDAALANAKAQPEGSEDRACLFFLAGALDGSWETLAAAIRAQKEPSA